MSAKSRRLVVVVATILLAIAARMPSYAQATTPTAVAEESHCFRADGGHDGLEEQIQAIVEEPVKFGPTFISPQITITETDENGDSVEAVITPVLVLLVAGDRNIRDMLAIGVVVTDKGWATENNAVVCDSEVASIVVVEFGEVIYEPEEIVGKLTATAAPSSTPDSCRNSVAAPDPEDRGLLADCAILLSARDTLAGAASLNWSVNRPLSEWEGVTVSDSRVIKLELNYNRLTGSIPTELGSLTNLETLSLYNNQLTGPIPASLGNLTKLQRLYLSNNQLTGPIPASLGNLTKLQRLSLRNNQLTGPIPASLGNLTNLRRLSLAGNKLTGCISPSLHSLSSSDLWILRLPGCIPDFNEARSEAVSLTYKDLFRYNESHVGKLVYFESEILQVLEEDGDYRLLANVTKFEYGFWDDAVLLLYESPPVRILEDDIVEFIAEVEGLTTYESIFGQSITVPLLKVIQLRLVEE